MAGDEVTLAAATPGLFLFVGEDGQSHLGLKTEYYATGNMEVFVAESGEAFWGGTSTFTDRAKIIVREVDAATLLRRLSPPADGWRPTHRHYKGGLYREIARGRWEQDLSPVVIYDNSHGETWVRPTIDFDGVVLDPPGRRFTPLPAPPSSEEAPA